jgi:glycosyltransferase involved in cell wall biosynthesis
MNKLDGFAFSKKNRKNTIGVITTHIPPAMGYGGPAVSVSVLIREWKKKGQEILLCSSDASIDGFLNLGDVQLGENVKVRLYHSYWFKRWAFGLGAIPAIYETCKHAGFVYINGNATWPMTLAPIICRILGRPYMVALRGGLMPEHVSMIRRRKYHKWLYYKWLSFPFLRKATTIHCTTKIEADAAREFLGEDINIAIVLNGIESNHIKLTPVARKDSLTLCYIGRISQEKGINGFIESWLECKRKRDRIIIAGSGVGEYFDEFKRLQELSEGSVLYKGYLDATGVEEVITKSNFLILPSGLERTDIRENFGNSVAEALALGRPVLVSRGLSWDHIEDEGIGFLFDRNADSVCSAIRKAQSISETTLKKMSSVAYNYAVENLGASESANKLWDMMNDEIR